MSPPPPCQPLRLVTSCFMDSLVPYTVWFCFVSARVFSGMKTQLWIVLGAKWLSILALGCFLASQQ